MTEDSETLEDFEADEPGVAGLSEVSEELDSSLWLGRISMAWDAIQDAAMSTQNAREWMSAWMPTVFALQGVGARMMTLGRALREVILGGRDLDLDEEFLQGFRDELAALADVFPDAGHLFEGVEVVDAAVDRVIASDLAREQARNLLAGLDRLIADLVATMIDIWLNPERLEISPEEATVYLERVEALLQRLVDQIMENVSFD